MGGKFLRRMEPYDYFGESCSFHESVRAASVIAECDVNPFNLTPLMHTIDNSPCYDNRQYLQPYREEIPRGSL
jgi:hypothetical protein